MTTPIIFVAPVVVGILLMKYVSVPIGMGAMTAMLIAGSIYSLASTKLEH